MLPDRRVHGHTRHGNAVVRYDRAGKWYVEGREIGRKQITVGDAARLATQPTSTPYLKIPGGSRFDALVVAALERKGRA